MYCIYIYGDCLMSARVLLGINKTEAIRERRTQLNSLLNDIVKYTTSAY